MTDQPREPYLPDEDPSRAAPPLPSYQPPPAPPPTADAASDPELRAKALERLEAVKGFRIHLTVYLAVIGFLTAIWLVTGGGYYWPIWPALGWGLGLGLHAASLGWDKEPTDEQIDREARRLAQRQPPRRPGIGGPRRDAIED